jgi:hypothetical protein
MSNKPIFHTPESLDLDKMTDYLACNCQYTVLMFNAANHIGFNGIKLA